MVGELQPEDPRSVGPYGLLGREALAGWGTCTLAAHGAAGWWR